jgi:hypothetical protein
MRSNHKLGIAFSTRVEVCFEILVQDAMDIETENAKLWRKIAQLQCEIVEWKTILQQLCP